MNKFVKMRLAIVIFSALWSQGFCAGAAAENSWLYVWPGWASDATFAEKAFFELVKKEATADYLLILSSGDNNEQRLWWLLSDKNSLLLAQYGSWSASGTIKVTGSIEVDELRSKVHDVQVALTTLFGVAGSDSMYFAQYSGKRYTVSANLTSFTVIADEKLPGNSMGRIISDIIRGTRQNGRGQAL